VTLATLGRIRIAVVSDSSRSSRRPLVAKRPLAGNSRILADPREELVVMVCSVYCLCLTRERASRWVNPYNLFARALLNMHRKKPALDYNMSISIFASLDSIAAPRPPHRGVIRADWHMTCLEDPQQLAAGRAAGCGAPAPGPLTSPHGL